MGFRTTESLIKLYENIAIMEFVENVTVGLEMEGGSLRTLSTGEAMHPADISWVIIPVSVPWKSDVELVRTPLRQTGAEEGGDMGQRTYYTAGVERDVPNSDNEYWSVKAEFDEYPTGGFEVYRVEHTDHVSYADFDSDDLLNYMHATL